MDLAAYRRPPGDTGIGFHYTASAPQGSDLGKFQRWAMEMRSLHATWTTILNPSVEVTRHALSVGIEPIHRFYIERPGVCPIAGEVLHHQQRFVQEGGGRWVLDPHNEVNNAEENPGGIVANPENLAKVWVPWAKAIISFGGYPSTPALSPGGTWDDLDYLRRFLREVARLDPEARGRIWDQGAWIAVHNYTLNHPVAYRKATNPDSPEYRSSFLGYEAVAKLAFALIGRELPVLSTEGGPRVGDDEDKTLPMVSEEQHAIMAVDMFNHMRPSAEGLSGAEGTAPRWYFTLNYWLIANYAAGFYNPAWEAAAWFKPDRHLIAVDRLREQSPPDRNSLWMPAPSSEPPKPESEVAPVKVAAQIYDTIVEKAATHGIDPQLAFATGFLESGLSPFAYREEPTIDPVSGWESESDIVVDGSLGIGQILRSTAKGWGIRGDAALYDLATNIDLMCRIIAANLQAWPDLESAIAAYNAGGGQVGTYGWTIVQGYVEKVKALMGRAYTRGGGEEEREVVLKQPAPVGWKQYGATVEEALQTLKGIADLHSDNLAYLQDLLAAARGGLPLRSKAQYPFTITRA